MDTRNPLYSGAESSSLWELTELKLHYHPSVQAFAKKIAAGEHIEYHSDPLLDFTLMRFLDRFVCKNPKQKVSDHGGSLMQRASKLVRSHEKEVAVNSAQFVGLAESKIREEELFMHKYYVQKASLEAKKSKKKKDRDKKGEDEEVEVDIDMEAFDAEMDFAGELERQSKVSSSKKKRKKRKGKRDGGDSDSDESDQDDEAAMDYDDMPSDEEEDSFLGAGGSEDGGDVSEAKLERLLLDNMSSSSSASDEEDDTSVQKPSKKRRKMKEDSKEVGKGFDPSSMFAAAEEFAHLLEESGSTVATHERDYGRRGGSNSQRKYQAPRKRQTRTKNSSKPHAGKNTRRKGGGHCPPRGRKKARK